MEKEYYEYDVEANELKPIKKREIGKLFSNVDKWKIVKQVVSMAASGCASVVINRYLKANMPAPGNAFETVVMGVGTYFITGVVGSKVSKYAEQELEDWRESISTVKEVTDGNGEA